MKWELIDFNKKLFTVNVGDYYGLCNSRETNLITDVVRVVETSYQHYELVNTDGTLYEGEFVDLDSIYAHLQISTVDFYKLELVDFRDGRLAFKVKL